MPKVFGYQVTKKTLLVNQPQLDELKALLQAGTESEAVREAIARVVANEQLKRAFRRIRERGRY
ncbi:MAG: hypothetical protein HYZ28_25805 [Myxococcales bacterium]|nr:hypothetical protein [Myxococcales bacterium]